MSSTCFCTKHMMNIRSRIPKLILASREAHATVLRHHVFAFTFKSDDGGKEVQKVYMDPHVSKLMLRFHTHIRDDKKFKYKTHHILSHLISPSVDPTSPWFRIPIKFQIRTYGSTTYVSIQKAEPADDKSDGIVFNDNGSMTIKAFQGSLNWVETWELIRRHMVLTYTEKRCGL